MVIVSDGRGVRGLSPSATDANKEGWKVGRAGKMVKKDGLFFKQALKWKLIYNLWHSTLASDRSAHGILHDVPDE